MKVKIVKLEWKCSKVGISLFDFIVNVDLIYEQLWCSVPWQNISKKITRVADKSIFRNNNGKAMDIFPNKSSLNRQDKVPVIAANELKIGHIIGKGQYSVCNNWLNFVFRKLKNVPIRNYFRN